MPGISTRLFALFALLLAAAIMLLAPALVVPGCSQYPAAEDAAAKAQETLAKARAHIDSVREYVDSAQQVATTSTNVTTELAAADLALQRERYREAIAHLRTALFQVESLGIRVPAEIPRRLVEAELLLGLLGR